MFLIAELESDIIDLYKDGLDKDNIRDNTCKINGQHYNNKKSFNVVFARKWKSLLNQGFLGSRFSGKELLKLISDAK
jgi:hypothetical protein